MPVQVGQKLVRRRPRPWKVRMFEYGIQNGDLMKLFDRSSGYITDRVSGKKPWNTMELMKLAGVLGVRSVEDFIKVLMPELAGLG